MTEQPRVIQATERLSVTLDAQTWNTVMTVLGEGPFRIVSPLIHEIHTQCNQQASTPRMNGDPPK